MRTEENCVRDRDRREGETQKVSERERKRGKMGIVQTTASTIKKKAQDYASHSERTRKIERDQKKISYCCCSHHYVKDRPRLRIYTRRFCLIFDTENVSSWSVPILLTLSTVEYQHEYHNDYHHHHHLWIEKKRNKQIGIKNKVILLYFVNWTNQASLFNMYIFNTKISRCSLCYALLTNNPTANSSAISYSSSASNRRYANRCSISSIERLISSSMKFERLWHKNENGLINNRSICFRCCDTIRQIEQIQTNIKQLNNDKQILINKIEHNLSKRALILQGQRQRTNHFLTNHQVRFPTDSFFYFLLLFSKSR